MFYHEASNKHIREGVAFTIPFTVVISKMMSVDGAMVQVDREEVQETQYPANWLNLSTSEEKAELGLVEVITEGERADERTHFVSEELNGAVRRIVNTPKSKEVLTTDLVQRKITAQASIDNYYEELYKTTVVNSAVGAEYDAAYMVATRWLKDTTQPVPERIKALSESYNVPNLQAAQIVVLKWTEAQGPAFDARGAARLRAKLAIRKATSVIEVDAAEAAGRAAMLAVVFSI